MSFRQQGNSFFDLIKPKVVQIPEQNINEIDPKEERILNELDHLSNNMSGKNK